MAKATTKAAATSAAKPTFSNLPRKQQAKPAITFEAVRFHAPSDAHAERFTRIFGLETVDYDGIRETTEECVGKSAHALEGNLNEKALAIHLQRVVASFVGSAFGAAQFYGNKVSQAQDLTMKSQNDDRDEDRDGVSGFESKAQSARIFAAQVGLQAYALMAAAEGAIIAYEHVVGEAWKPYVGTSPANATVARQSAEAELAAFG